MGQGVAGLAVALAGIFTALTSADNEPCLSVGDDSFTRLEVANSHLEGTHSGGRGLGSSSSACSDYTIDWGTLVYFALGASILLMCFVTYPLFQRLPVALFYTRLGKGATALEDAEHMDSDAEGLNSHDMNSSWGSFDDKGKIVGTSVGPSVRELSLETPTFQLSAEKNLLPDHEAETMGEMLEQDEAGVKGKVMHGIRSRLAPIARYTFTVFFCLMVSLSVFPGATSGVLSSRRCEPGRSRFFAKDIFTLFSFVSYNTFDFLGRLTAGVVVLIPNRWLPTAAVVRLVFIPLILLCRSDNSRLPALLLSDIYPLTIVPALGLSNGYFTTLATIAGTRHGPWAGTAMALFTVGGCFTGSLLSFLVLYISTGSFT